MNYIVISPAFNEAAHIRHTLDSITKQTIFPIQWIIVNDGSSDNTSDIIKEYCGVFPWIKLLDCQKENVEFGVHAVVNFYKGLNACDTNDWDFIMKLDTDLDIDRSDFFEYQLKKFIESPGLGICSGLTYSIINGEKVLTKGRHYWRTGGAMKFYRRTCFEQIGGLAPIYGWDGLDEYKAMFHGWKTRTFPELLVNHFGKKRANSRNQNKNFFEKRGISLYQRGYPFEFVLFKFIFYGLTDPLKGLAFIKGYFKAYINKEQIFCTRKEKKYFRKIQYMRVLDRFSNHELL